MSLSSDSEAAPSGGRAAGWRRAAVDALQLVGLNAFVAAQPMYDRLAHNPGFLSQESIRPPALILTTILLLTLIPGALLIIEGVARLFGARWRRRVHVTFVALLLGLLTLQALSAASVAGKWRHVGISGFVLLAATLLVVWWLMRSYRRGGWVDALVTYASLGALLFPVLFVLDKNIAARLSPEVRTQTPGAQAARPTPIVMIIFDGLSGMALLNERHEIDSVRYPSFARLAAMSTWHRNATTVHYRTDNAVPSLLTGNFPPGDLPPTLAEYPQNLFTLLIDSQQYDMTVFEPYTRLCPDWLRDIPRPRSNLSQTSYLLQTLAPVWVETTLPHDLLPIQLDIPREWMRLPDTDLSLLDDRKGLIIYGWDTDRDLQIEHFLQCLQPSEKPSLRFLHLVTPHYPWCYFPSGRQYLESADAGDLPLGTLGELGELWGSDELAVVNGWRRYLLQLQCADRWLGRILDRLEEIDALDESLLVVTGDHGVAFVPDASRREPTPATLPDLMPIPMFIKLPGQRQPEVTDRNVQSVDLLPTMADAIDLELPDAVDGISLLAPRETSPPSKRLIHPPGPFILEGSFPEKYRYVDRMLEVFGSGEGEDRLWTAGQDSQLRGVALAEVTIGPPSEYRIELMWGGRRVDPAYRQVVPSLYQGRVLDIDATRPLQVAVAVDGVIECVTRTYLPPADPGWFSALVPESRLQPGDNDVRLFEVRAANNGPTLHEFLHVFP